ncbi:MAG: prepilin-type N-terminal cleavage/methylation domain-containing protein, partial [Gammaproteobacteria bacterium]|nr:prepilin-type N-terminal cleavage/methylation domain-containing protein [Gammaproteobacteria bacterium]
DWASLLFRRCKRLSVMRRVKGFTLVELMVTLVILGILLGVGIPSFRALMQGNAMVAASNQLLGALLLARSEAVKRESQVTFTTTAGGWQITDLDGNVLLTHTVNNAAIVVAASGAAGGGITFGSDGRSLIRYAAADFLKISFDEGGERQICLSPAGRPWIEREGDCS